MKIRNPCIAFIMCAVLFEACKQEEKTPASADIIPVVEMTTIRSMQPSIEVVLPGELKPWNKAPMFAKVKGYVGRVNVDRGSIVKMGQTLAQLEAPEIIAALNQAKAHVSVAEASMVEQRAKHQASAMTYRRIVETSQTAGAVSANELDLAYSRMITDSAIANAAQDNLRAAQAQYTSQAQLVNYLTVRAPFEGTITERNISPGELVGEGNSKPLFVLEDRSTLRLTVAVPENLSNSIQDKSAVTFSVQADPLKIYEAQFSRSANTIQENNRTMMAEFDFKNQQGDLKAGMYAEVKLPMTRNKPTLFVPQSALIHSTEGVFIVRIKDDFAEWVRVQKGNTLDSLVEVFGTVKEGERIVKKAYDELRNGQPLKAK